MCSGESMCTHLVHCKMALDAEVDFLVLSGIGRCAVAFEPFLENIRCFFGKIAPPFSVEGAMVISHVRLEAKLAIRVIVPRMRSSLVGRASKRMIWLAFGGIVALPMFKEVVLRGRVTKGGLGSNAMARRLLMGIHDMIGCVRR